MVCCCAAVGPVLSWTEKERRDERERGEMSEREESEGEEAKRDDRDVCTQIQV